MIAAFTSALMRANRLIARDNLAAFIHRNFSTSSEGVLTRHSRRFRLTLPDLSVMQFDVPVMTMTPQQALSIVSARVKTTNYVAGNFATRNDPFLFQNPAPARPRMSDRRGRCHLVVGWRGARSPEGLNRIHDMLIRDADLRCIQEGSSILVKEK